MAQLPSPNKRLALLAAAMRVPLHVPESFIASATNEKCQTKPMEHSGTSRSEPMQNCKTNPTEHSGTSRASTAPAPERMQNCKTNPMEHSGTSALSYRQLAAARFIVRGRGSVEIGQRLGIARHTVARWKHNPLFMAEVERLRQRLTRAALAPLRPVT